MDKSEKDKLQHEYVDKLFYTLYIPLRTLGLCRYDIKDGKIVKKSSSSLIYSISVLVLLNVCAFCLVYRTGYLHKSLLVTEMLIVLDFNIFHTCLVLNIAFANKRRVAQFINAAIDIDTFFGVEETEFMRRVADNTIRVLFAFVLLTHVIVMLALYYNYLVDIIGYITGSLNFFLLFFVYYDLSFFLTLYTFLTLRVRYLNVAILKIANIDPKIIPDQFPFNTLFWDDKFDILVEFHSRATPGQYTRAFRMIFDQVRCLEKSYRFTIFMCLTYSIAGTFIIVQNGIIYAKASEKLDTIRLLTLTLWGLLSWSFQVTMTLQTDMFYKQIKQTTLICTYTQLKPMYPDEIYSLTRNIITTLEERDARLSIYGMFYYDTGLLLHIAASIFVYITMQLQLAYPTQNDVVVDNTTYVDP